MLCEQNIHLLSTLLTNFLIPFFSSLDAFTIIHIGKLEVRKIECYRSRLIRFVHYSTLQLACWMLAWHGNTWAAKAHAVPSHRYYHIQIYGNTKYVWQPIRQATRAREYIQSSLRRYAMAMATAAATCMFVCLNLYLRSNHLDVTLNFVFFLSFYSLSSALCEFSFNQKYIEKPQIQCQTVHHIFNGSHR